MTRQDILKMYNVNERQVITSLGKFQGEMIYALYFWDLYLNGFYDDDDGEKITFILSVEDKKEFPELNDKEKVFLYSDNNGFIYCKAI